MHELHITYRLSFFLWYRCSLYPRKSNHCYAANRRREWNSRKIKTTKQNGSAQYVFQQTIFNSSSVHVRQFAQSKSHRSRSPVHSCVASRISLQASPPCPQSGSASDICSWSGPLSRRAPGPELSFVCGEPKGSLAGRQVGCQAVVLWAGACSGIERYSWPNQGHSSLLYIGGW